MIAAVGNGSTKLPSIDWRASSCGGAFVNGTSECVLDEELGKVTTCKCANLPKHFNAMPHFALAQAIFMKKLHLSRDCTEWDKLKDELFTTGSFKRNAIIGGNTLKQRFDGMIEAVRTKHDLPKGGSSQGFETHQEMTAYDNLVIKMIKEIDVANEKKEKEKAMETQKKNTMLGHETTLGMIAKPVIVRSKTVSDVFNDEGELVENGMTSQTPIEPHADLNTTITTNSSKSSAANDGDSGTKKPRKRANEEDEFTSCLREFMKPESEEDKNYKLRKLSLEERKLELEEKKADNMSKVLEYFLANQMSVANRVQPLNADL